LSRIARAQDRVEAFLLGRAFLLGFMLVRQHDGTNVVRVVQQQGLHE
jgi:hypothetical protein